MELCCNQSCIYISADLQLWINNLRDLENISLEQQDSHQRLTGQKRGRLRTLTGWLWYLLYHEGCNQSACRKLFPEKNQYIIIRDYSDAWTLRHETIKTVSAPRPPGLMTLLVYWNRQCFLTLPSGVLGPSYGGTSPIRTGHRSKNSYRTGDIFRSEFRGVLTNTPEHRRGWP